MNSKQYYSNILINKNRRLIRKIEKRSLKTDKDTKYSWVMVKESGKNTKDQEIKRFRSVKTSEKAKEDFYKYIKSNDIDIRKKDLKLDKSVNFINGYTFIRLKNPTARIEFTKEYRKNITLNNLANIRRGTHNPNIDRDRIYNIKKFSEKKIPKYNAIRTRYNVELRKEFDFNNLNQTLNTIYRKEKIVRNIKSQDKIRFIITSIDGSIIGSTKYRRPSEIGNTFLEDNNESFIREFSSTAGMNGEEIMKSVGNIEIAIIKAPRGGRGINAFIKGNIKNKKSVVSINNKDDLCLGRAIVIALAVRDKHPKLQQIKEGRKIQTTLTHELYNRAGIPQEIGDITTIEEFQKYLDCCISVIDTEDFLNIIYQGDLTKEFKIYILKTKNHFDYINSNKIAGFFGKDYFCKKCNKTYTNKHKHRCISKCNICCSTDCDCIDIDFKKHTDWTGCNDCNRNFPSSTCFNIHKESGSCDKFWKCKDCKKKFDSKRFDRNNHTCGEYWCNNCKTVVNKDHKCYMMPKPIKQIQEQYIFFDFEATQNTGIHKVNLSVSQYFHDPTPIIHYDTEKFCEWLFDIKHKNYTIIAHNGKGYDYQFILKYIYTKTSLKPFIVYSGSKIMTFSIKQGLNIRFVDSVNFLASRLEDFPKTFGIKELKKGFYPHLFNTAENYEYIGDMPPRKDFCCNSFNEDKRKEFLIWYKNKIDNKYIWNNKKELLDYCISDVDILRRSMMIFRKLYIDIADIDPLQYTTIASVCMAIYRGHYIVEDFNTNYNIALQNDTKEEFLEETRKKVFEEKKIAVLHEEDQEYIRKSFFGGRTNAIALKYEFKGSEIGRYRDITSLYPTVNYYDEYGLGHLKTIKSNFGDLKSYKGFVDCSVIPPKDLYFPVLPTKGDKLYFDLKDKRGIWTTQEVNKAVEQGYKIKKIYSIKYYTKTSNTLFRNYVEKFLKIKQQASGYPDWVKTEKHKDKYINDYFKIQNIRLDKDKIKFNKGLRAVSKLCLNSLWGKFGMRNNMPKTEVINDKKRFNKLMFSDCFKDQNVFFIDDNRVEINYRDRELDTTSCGSLANTTNIGIASFTTSWARLRLYEGLEKLGKQVLYHDTDSIVYKYDKNNPKDKEIELGDGLGDWTDELEGAVMCGTFISGGPKNYSYETDDGIYHTKIKGFNLNYSVSKILNHDSMIDIVLNRDKEREDNFREVKIFQINRNKDKTLSSIIQPKRYAFGYDKRSICSPDLNNNIFTLPHGYKILK